MNTTQLHHAIRNGVVCGLAIVGLAGIASIHLLDAQSQFEETPYLGWVYVALILGPIAIAGSLGGGDQACGWTLAPRAWPAAGVPAFSAVAGYTLSRTTELPGASGDSGNWGEQLGIASLFVEGTVVAVSAFALHDRVPQARVRALAGEVAR